LSVNFGRNSFIKSQPQNLESDQDVDTYLKNFCKVKTFDVNEKRIFCHKRNLEIGNFEVDILTIGNLAVSILMIGNLEVSILAIGNLAVGTLTIGNLKVDILTIGNLEVDILMIGDLAVGFLIFFAVAKRGKLGAARGSLGLCAHADRPRSDLHVSRRSQIRGTWDRCYD
jgi:hypothetical protein